MNAPMNGIRRVALIAAVLLPNHLFAQTTPSLSVCLEEAKAPACDAARGDRADGWRAQSRAEVMAPHAMVATSQPLAQMRRKVEQRADHPTVSKKAAPGTPRTGTTSARSR